MQTVDYKLFELSAGDKVLDLGCGEGRHVISVYLEEEVESIGVDLCLKDLAAANQKYQMFAAPEDKNRAFHLSNADALNLPFADNTFDKVLCSEVLEHIPDWQAALVEIKRVLKPEGIFCASVPRYWPEKICWMLSDEYHANEGGHLRIFTSKQFKDAIESLGFNRYKRHWAHALHSPYWWLQCASWENRDKSKLVSWYHKLLVWDLMERPWITRTTESLLNPIMGKSVVMYFRNETAA
jgi:ubiquinone/menaquinone biosynthesis C-methylase UbiE